MNDFIKGMDISSIIEMEELGAKYFLDGEEKDLFEILKINGVNSIRIRLWVDPYDNNHKPYLGGTVDLDKALTIAKRAKALNMSILLDFHYSDFWVDPSKQTLPKMWYLKLNSGAKIEDLIYEYTFSTLSTFKVENINVDYVQIGNEITNGMCWPYAKLDCYIKDKRNEKQNNLIKILNNGIKASKEVFKDIKTIVHLERSGFTELIDSFLSIIDGEVDYDILGFSYYPYWHKKMKNLQETIDMVNNKYHKEMMIVETSFAYSDNPAYLDGTKLPLVVSKDRKDAITTQIEYEISLDGQEKFLKDLFKLARKSNLLGIYYWEPAMINVKGVSWASDEAMKYINEKKSYGNEWANQTLFDENGNALNSLKIIKNL